VLILPSRSMEAPRTILLPTPQFRRRTADVCSISLFNDYTGEPHPLLAIRCAPVREPGAAISGRQHTVLRQAGSRGPFKSHG
jgi:hypothetical protein